VREEQDRLVAEIEWIPGRTLICSNCSRRTARIHARQAPRERRDLSVRDRPLVLRCAPAGVRCPACGPRVEHLNRAVDEVRRQTWRALSGQAKTAFKRTRWLWLKNPWNLKNEEQRRLSVLCRQTNRPIVRAYYLSLAKWYQGRFYR
jgi:transposase